MVLEVYCYDNAQESADLRHNRFLSGSSFLRGNLPCVERPVILLIQRTCRSAGAFSDRSKAGCSLADHHKMSRNFPNDLPIAIMKDPAPDLDLQ